MFRQAAYYWKLYRVNQVHNAISDAMDAGNLSLASQLVEKADKLLHRIILPRTALINAIAGWGMMSLRFSDLGANELALRCQRVATLLQARFDAGDYWDDPEWARGR